MFSGLPTAFALFKNANHKYNNDQQSVLMRTMHDLHTNNIRAIDVDAITNLLNQRQQSEDSMDTRARKAMLLLAASWNSQFGRRRLYFEISQTNSWHEYFDKGGATNILPNDI